jgi:hypothetical protein
MRSSHLSSASVVTLLLSLTLVAPASAQTLEEEMAASEGDGASGGSGEPGGEVLGSGSSVVTVDSDHSLNDDQAELEEVAPVETVDDGISPGERPDTDYFFLGAFMRALFVPDFIQGLFVSYEGGTAINGAGGAYFGWRRNGFNVIAEVWYAGFGHQGFYHGSGADDSEYESVQSNLGVVFGSFLFGWTIPVTEWLGIDIGFGLGFGGMTGNLTRTEAYRDRTVAGAPLRECADVGTPDATYCEGPREMANPTTGRLDDTRLEGGTYQRLTGTNPFYFGDGGVPPVFFWLDLPRIGVTIRPIRQIQIRLDGGYNLYGFNVGGSIGYGF